MFNRFVTNKARITKLVFLVSALFVVNNFAAAQFNPEINYQGKLTDTTGMAVTDGTYNMNFWLVPTSGGATSTAVWSEARTGANRVQVTNGLFSVMLGDVSSLAGVDFNQTLYLAVEIGGTGTPAWDGELLPRKILGAVPAAFVAETAGSADALSGIASSSFLRSDEVDTMTASSSSSLLTLVQNGVGKVLSLFSGASEVFTVLSNGNVGIGTTTPAQRLSVGATTGSQFLVSSTGVVSDGTWNADAIGATYGGTGLTTVNQNQLLIGGAGNTWSQVATSSLGLYGVAADSITSAQLLSSVTNETGTGALVFGTSPTFTTQITSPLVVGGTAAGSNLSLKSTSGVGTTDYIRFLVGNNGGTEAMRVTNDGYLGIGTPTPSSLLDVGGFSTTNYTMKTGTLGLQSYSLNNGLLGENSYYVNGDGWKRMATGYASSIHLFQGQTMFNTANTGTGDFTQTLPLKATWSNSGSVALGGNIDVYPTNFTGASMVVLGTGNVGIGTTTPSQRLSVGATTGSQFLVSSAGVVTDGTWNADVIGGAYGGTGLSSVTQNQLLIGGAGNTWSQVATSSLGLSASFSTSAQLASLLSDEVGTGGGFVRASSTMLTSPTLITPALGTPSSGVLTNATGLPVSTGIAGLGTGVATFLATPSSANLISAVTDETGTGALVFANSPTLTGTLSGANATFSGTLGVSGTSTLATTTASTLTIAGALRDSSASAGTAGMVLQSTGTSTRWVATSTLGFTSGATTFLGLTDTPSSFTANRIIFTNSGATALTDSADLTYDGTNLGLGSGDGISFNGVRYFTASSTQYSLSLGHGAGSGGNSVTVGYFTGSSNTGVNLVALGQSAAQNNTGIHLNAIGRNAGTNNSGQYSNLFGESAGYSNAGDNVIAIGNEAMGSTTAGNTGSNNIALGYRSLFNARSGGNNIALGYRAADNLTTGANNIVIGYDLDAPSATNNNQLNIGNLIFGTGLDGTGTTLSTGNIGIGTTTPGSKLTVAGDLRLTGAFRDSTNASGTAGMVLQTTGSGTQWVATSSLGFTSGASTFLALTDTPSSYTANRIMYTNSGATALTDTANFVFDGTNLGLGTSSPSQMLTVGGTAGSQFLVSSTGVVSDGTWNADAIGATYGGTGLTSVTQNQLLIGGAGNTWSQVATSSLGLSASFTTSAELAALLSDEVGTDGGFVRASSSMLTSPILVTPNLGTPSAGVLTNATGLPVATGIAGLGSGVATFLSTPSSANLISAVTDETGTGALVFANSPTLTGTLSGANATLSGTLGVSGTSTLATTTASTLTIAGALRDSSASAGTAGMVLQTTGTSTRWTATSTLGLYGTTASSITSAQLLSSVSNETGTGVLVFGTSPTFTTQITAPQVVGGTAAASNLTLKSTSGVGTSDYVRITVGNNGATEALRAITSGNIGIGTTTPGSKLTVAGDIFATGAFRDSSNASGTLGMVLQSTGTSTRWVATSTLGITGGGGSSLFTDAGATTYLTATGDNLGIGTTTAGSRLTVDGDINLTGAIKFNNVSAIKSSSGNVVFGEYALPTSNSNIYSNTVLGELAANNLVSGSTNVFLGFYAGRSLSTSTNNVVIGNQAVGETDGGTEIGGAVIIGRRAGYNLEGNFYHTFIGDAAGENVTTGGENTLIGNQAGSSITTGGGNIVLGSWSTTGITTGDNNVIIGNNISGLSSSLANNIIIADGAGNRRINVDSSGNVGIGTTTQSSKLTIAGDIFATGALRDSSNSAGTAGMVLQTTGSGTQWVATSTLGITGGGSSLFTDAGATTYLTATGDNLGIGTTTADSRLTVDGDINLTGAIKFNNISAIKYSSGNIAFGEWALFMNSAGYSNVGIGNRAGNFNENGDSNVFVGEASGLRLATTSGSVVIGSGAAGSTEGGTEANNLVILGAGAGKNIQTGAIGSTFMGFKAGENVTTGAGNTIIGWEAAANLTTGGGNIVIGYDVDIASTTGSDQLNIGNLIFGTGLDGRGTTLSSGNLGIGTTTPGSKLTIAGDAYLTGAFRDSSNASGTLGMVLQSTGTSTRWVATSTLGLGGSGGSLFTDAGATTYLTSTSDNLSIGTTTSSALLTVDGTIAALDGIKFGGQRSVFIDSSSNMTFGEWALFYAENNANVYANIGIGDNAANNLRSGFSNVFMGFSAGANMATGSRSVVIGDHAVGNNPGVANIGAMVVIGDGAGQDLEDGANWQTLVGYRAGENITTGSGNVIFGYQAGNNITTGWENIVIGYDIDAPSASSNNTLNIGNIIFGNSIDGTGTTVSTGNIGIGTSTPNAKLTVNGSGSNIFALYSSTATTTMLVESDGEVGFGATPNAQMTIFGRGQTSAALSNSGNKGGVLSIVDDNNSAGSGGAIVFGNSQSKSYGSLGHAAIKGLLVDGTNNTVGHLAFSTRNGTSDTSLTERMRIEYGGNVAIGTTTAAQKLQVWGNIRVGTSGTNGCLERFDGTALTGTCSSDEDLKTNINELSNDDRSYLEGIAALDTVTYQWNEVAEDLYKRNTETTAIGLIAQEVEIIFPELVSIDDKGYRQVDLASLPFYIIQAIKEIWVKLTDQQEKIDELEERIQYLESLQSGGGGGGGGGSNPPPAPPVDEGGDTEGGGTGEVDSEGGNSEPIEIPPEEPAPDTEGGGTEVTEEPPAEDTSSAADDGGETESELPAEEGPAVTEEGG